MARTASGAMGASGQTIRSTPGSVARSSRRSMFRLRYLFVAVVVAWAGYHYFTHQLPQYQALKHQEATLTKQLQSLTAEHQQLQTQQSELQNKQYILDYAAKHYNLLLPGQVAFDIQH